MKAGDLLVELDKRQARPSWRSTRPRWPSPRPTERQAEDAYRRDLATSREAVSDQQRISTRRPGGWPRRSGRSPRRRFAGATALDLLEIRAPSAGTILQVNVPPGEYVSVLGGRALILMGDLHPLHVRVDIDENDAPRLPQEAPAQASLRGTRKFRTR